MRSNAVLGPVPEVGSPCRPMHCRVLRQRVLQPGAREGRHSRWTDLRHVSPVRPTDTRSDLLLACAPRVKSRALTSRMVLPGGNSTLTFRFLARMPLTPGDILTFTLRHFHGPSGVGDLPNGWTG